ncbi:uncharacterized protein LOC135136498 isoform X1 [Zophobas morio]|uniref:uncharacterized protein LOC135136498 isoform X1 n=1 Tax=Zophobas morio TaxID=2755281 RepID=UPI0030832051
MDPERRAMEDDSLQECERRFREICMKVINKNHAKSPRKKLFGNTGPLQKIALRPSMIDRACLKKAVFSSTPMPHNKQQPFTPDSSGSVSPISDCAKENESKNSQPIVEVNRLNFSEGQNKSVISISSNNVSQEKEGSRSMSVKKNANDSIVKTKSMNVSASDGKREKLNNIVSKLILNKSVDSVPATTNKLIQTSDNSRMHVQKPAISNQLSKALLRTKPNTQVRETQTGTSLCGSVRRRSSSLSDMSDNPISVCETSRILALNLVVNKSDESSSDHDVTPDAGVPWRVPSGLQDHIPPVPNEDRFPNFLEETLDDDTFLPKPPKKKKVFVNKKKKAQNSEKKKVKGRCSSVRKKTQKVNLDDERTNVEELLKKESAQSVACTSLEPTVLSTKKKRRNKIRSTNLFLHNGTLEGDNELLTADSPVFIPVVNNKLSCLEQDKAKNSVKEDNNNQTFSRVQDHSIKKRRSVNKKRGAVASTQTVNFNENDANRTITRSMSKTREQSPQTKETAASNNSVFDKTNSEVSRSGREKYKSKNVKAAEKSAKTNSQSQFSTDFDPPENRETTKETKNSSKRKLDQTKEKGRADVLIGDSRTSTSKSAVVERRTLEEQSSAENIQVQTDVPDVSQDVLEEFNASVPAHQNTIGTSSSKKRINKKEDSKMNVNTKSKRKIKKKSKNSTDILQDLQSAPLSHLSTEDNNVEPVLPGENGDIQNSLNSSTFPDRLEEKGEYLKKTVNTSKNRSANQSNMKTKQNAKTKKKDTKVSNPELTAESSYPDSGIGTSSSQLQTFKKPAPVKKKAPKEAEVIEEPLIRRSTRQRRPAPVKTAGQIICRNQKEYDRENKYFTGVQKKNYSVNKNSSSRVSKSSTLRNSKSNSSSSSNRETTRGPSCLRSTINTCSPIAEIGEINFDEENLQPVAHQSSSKATPQSRKNKNYVLGGKAQKVRNNTKKRRSILQSVKKTLEENTPSELVDLVDICVGDKIHSTKWSVKNPKLKKLNGMSGVSACVISDFANGLLKIDGGKSKPRQVAMHHQLSFCVFEGRAQVGVQNKSQILTTLENFVVPAGCEYFIKNLDDEKPLMLFFTKTVKSS